MVGYDASDLGQKQGIACVHTGGNLRVQKEAGAREAIVCWSLVKASDPPGHCAPASARPGLIRGPGTFQSTL